MAMRLLVAGYVLFATALCCCISPSWAQQSDAQTKSDATPNQQNVSARLNEVSVILKDKRAERDALTAFIASAAVGSAIDEREKLTALTTEINRLRATFEMLAVGDVDLELLQEPSVDYDWRQELVEIVSPLLDTLKSVTLRPRQKTELRESIQLNTGRIELADTALASLEQLSAKDLDAGTLARLQQLTEKWRNDRQSFTQALLVDQAQLERLDSTTVSFTSGFWPAVQKFLLGRGLTLALAAMAAVVAWLGMRIVWWLFSTRVVSKEQRRNRVWYRLLSYSYYLLNFIVVLVVVIAVLYIREDLLLLALAVVLIAVTALGLRKFIPEYLREARLLLNLGSVREGERVMYLGIPWQVMSLNLHTVLRNPALDGVLRIPLNTVSELSSRPIKDDLWFPCERDDYILLPDGTFASVVQMTPELVQLRVNGGMMQSWCTADFYAASITNLSRGPSYGIAVTFGYGYGLQALCLSEVSPKLKLAIEQAMEEAGLAEHLLDLLVDFSAAGESSLDYLIFATISSDAASSYFKVRRVIQQTCVAVANQQGWEIPFPQMTIHRLPIEAN